MKEKKIHLNYSLFKFTKDFMQIKIKSKILNYSYSIFCQFYFIFHFYFPNNNNNLILRSRSQTPIKKLTIFKIGYSPLFFSCITLIIKL